MARGREGGAGQAAPSRICETSLGSTPICARRERCLCHVLTLLRTILQDYTGLAWLFLGVANSDALLYDDEWQPIVKNFPNNFKLDYALSREQKNKAGGKMYIQDKVGEYADEVFTRMDNGGHMYFCGLKGMMPGILEMLDGVSKEKGIVWEDKLKEWKKNGQWHVEVY